jgi:dihydrofolate reductase
MSKLRVHNVSVSVDGYMAGPDQSLEDPLGIGGTKLHEWAFATRSFQGAHGTKGAGETGLDDDFMARGLTGIGATILGRNMFAPSRGAWLDESWRGWWGEETPFPQPVFVLTHHARPPFTTEDGTVFTFVTDGIEAALEQAVAAADGGDVRLGGGASAIQQYLRAGLIDDLHLAIVPVLLGGGERVFDNLDGGPDGYECVEFVSSAAVAHVRFAPIRAATSA